MNKTIFALNILLGIALCSSAQNQIEFANEFMPKSKYVVTTNTHTIYDLTYDASEDFMRHLQAKGKNATEHEESTSTSKLVYKTGRSSNGQIPIAITYVKTGLSQDGLIRDGETVKATYNTKDKIVITQMPDESRADGALEQVMTMMSDGFSADLFNTGMLAVGDSVTLVTPLSFPTPSLPIQLDMSTTYKLKSIQAGKAYLDITSIFKLDALHPSMNLGITGGGTGHCIYDIAKRRIIDRTNNTKLVMEIQMSRELNIIMVQETTTVESTVIK
jgi:hypothetical protein